MDESIKDIYRLFLKHSGVVSETRKSKSMFYYITAYTIYAKCEIGWKRFRLAISDIRVSISESLSMNPLLAIYKLFLYNDGKVSGVKTINKDNGEITQYTVYGIRPFPTIFRVHRLDNGCFITADYEEN